MFLVRSIPMRKQSKLWKSWPQPQPLGVAWAKSNIQRRPTFQKSSFLLSQAIKNIMVVIMIFIKLKCEAIELTCINYYKIWFTTSNTQKTTELFVFFCSVLRKNVRFITSKLPFLKSNN